MRRFQRDNCNKDEFQKKKHYQIPQNSIVLFHYKSIDFIVLITNLQDCYMLCFAELKI